MPRIRSIHPGLFTDEAYMALSPYAMAAWPGVWIQADDQGVFEWKPLTLKARLLPAASVDMIALLAEYEAQGLVRRFEADGHSYAAIRNFRRYQRPVKPNSLHPLPDDLRVFVGLPPPRAVADRAPSGRQPITNQSPTGSQPVRNRLTTGMQKSPQREEVRDKREDGGGRNPKTHTAEHRPAPACEASPRVCVKDFNFEEKPPPSGIAELEAIWPNSRGQAFVAAAYRGARHKADADTIQAGALAYVERNRERYKTGTEMARFTKELAAWLREERWTDEAAEPADAFAGVTSPIDEWRSDMRWYVRRVQEKPETAWHEGVWGPAPGDPDCRVPAQVLAEFGLPPTPPQPPPPTPEDIARVSRMMAEVRAPWSSKARAPRNVVEPVRWVEETPEERAEFEAMKAAALAELRADMGAAAAP